MICAIPNVSDREKMSLRGERLSHEGPGSKVLEVNLQNDQGLSPRSSALIAREMQNSTPCDRLENVWSSTREIIQSYSSRSTVTFMLGLFFGIRDIEYRVIASKCINTHEIIFHSTTLNVVGDSQNEQTQSTSESSETRAVHPQPDVGRNGHAREQDTHISAHHNRMVSRPVGKRTQGHEPSVPRGVGGYPMRPFVLSGGA